MSVREALKEEWFSTCLCFSYLACSIFPIVADEYNLSSKCPLQGFPYSRDGGVLPPPTKQQFSSYHPVKIDFLTVVIAPAPFLF